MPRHVNTGIAIEADVPGVVPEYEMLEAATYCHYNMLQWEELEARDRALCVAQYRTHNAIEAHVQDAVSKSGNNKPRAATSRRTGSSS